MSTTASAISAPTSAPATAATSKKKKIMIAAASVVALGVAYMSYQSFMYVHTDNAQIHANTVMLSSRVQGYLVKVNVVENQKVKAGEVLAEIDPRDYENSVSVVAGERGSLVARQQDAARNFQRMSQLFKEGVVSQQQRDSAEAAYREATSQLSALSSRVDQAKLNLGYSQIRAPSDGVVARKSAEVGMFAQVGLPLFGFVSSDSRWVTANFKETDVASIRIGAKVDIAVDALGGRGFEGVVESVSPATGATFTLLPPDNATGNFTKVVQRVPVRIAIKDLDEATTDLLRAGLSAEVKIHKH